MTTRPLPFPATTCRIGVLAAVIALLFAAPLPAANPEYTSLAGVKAAGFQKWLDDASSQGYEPIYVIGYNVGDHAEYAGVAIKNPRPSECRFDMTDDEYKQFYNEMSKKGYEPTDVSGYHTKGGPRFAAVWVKRKVALEWKARHNQTQKEYEDAVATMRDDGLEPTCVTAYQGPDGGVRYTSVFYAPGEGVKWETRHNLTADQLEDQVDKWRLSHFRVWRVHAYDTPDGLRFLATAQLDQTASPFVVLWKERHGMSGDQYQKEFDKRGADGFMPICICGYLDGGEVHFAAVWKSTKAK